MCVFVGVGSVGVVILILKICAGNDIHEGFSQGLYLLQNLPVIAPACCLPMNVVVL